MDSKKAEEILDVVNEHDKVIGQATRSECHSNPNLMHRTVHFTLADKIKKKILITQRSYKKKHDAGKLCFPGEHILSGETYRDALIRGVKEELGFVPIRFKECATHVFRYDSQTELIKFYLVYLENQKLKWDKNEMERVFWVDVSELLSGKGYSEMAGYWINNINWGSVLSSEY